MRRAAFTLIELCLVLAVLVVLTAAAWPALDAMLNTRGLNAAADQVRAAWIKARLEAQTTGQIYQFRCEPGGATYEISVYDQQTYDETIATVTKAESEQISSGFASSAGGGVPIGPQTLPEGITFAALKLVEDGRDAPTRQGAGVLPDASGLSPPVLFYADGTTSSVTCVLGDQKQLYMLLVMRGLTGVVSVSEPLSEDELP